MIAPTEGLSVMATANDAAALMARSEQRVAPVLDKAGPLRGMVLRERVLKATKRNAGATPVLELMVSDVPTVPESASLETAIPLLFGSRARCVGVVDGSGSFVGYLTPESISKRLAAPLGSRGQTSGWRRG
jgi:CBS domain-containing protein